MGRPTKYDPSYCEKVIEWGRAGKSKTWIASELNVTRECLYEWMRTNQEFSDAMTRAKQLEQRWWEDKGQDGLDADKFNGGVWSRSMAARFPQDWRESQDVNYGVQDSLAELMKELDGKHGRIPNAPAPRYKP